MSDIPKILKLGLIPADTEYRAVFEVLCDDDCDTEKNACVRLSHEKLSAGKNSVTLTVSPLREGTILYTHIKLGEDKVFVTAEAVRTGFEEQDRIIRYIGNAEKDEAERLYLTRFPDGKYGETEEIILTRGSRMPLGDGKIEAVFVFEADGKSHDIDAYVFMHSGNGILKSPADLIFFGNDASADGAVNYLNAPDKRALYVDLAKLREDINQLDFVFAFYGGGEIFSRLNNAGVKISAGGRKMFIPLAENAGVIAAFDITRQSGGFVLSPLIMPFRKGIDTLCKNYGLKVR
jgi:stress response protein SCP2